MSSAFGLPVSDIPKSSKYGWWVVIVSALCMFVVYGLSFYPLSVAFKDIQAEFHINRSSLSGVIALFGIVTAVGGLLAGRLCDRFGAPRVMKWSAPIVGLGIILVGYTQNLWQLYAAYAVISIGVSGVSLVSVNVLVSRWFGEKRGRAVGWLTTGVSLGGFGGPLATGFLLTRFGWRATFVILGLSAWALLLPTLIWVVKDVPLVRGPDSDNSRQPTGTRIETRPARRSFTLSQSMRTFTFWLQALTFFLVSSAWVGILSHAVNFFRDRGMSPAEAALGPGLASVMGMWAKPLSGYLSDRMSRIGLFVGFLLFQAGGVFLITRIQGETSAYLAFVVLGIGGGGAVPLRPLITNQFFGNLQFGSLFGAFELAYGLGATVGPLIAGVVFDLMGNYTSAFYFFLSGYGLAVTSFLLAYYLRPGRKP